MHCTAAYELTEQSQYPHALSWVGRIKALVEADLGLVDEARSSIAAGLEFTRATGNEFSTIHCLSALGRLELAVGDLESRMQTAVDACLKMVVIYLRPEIAPQRQEAGPANDA